MWFFLVFKLYSFPCLKGKQVQQQRLATSKKHITRGYFPSKSHTKVNIWPNLCPKLPVCQAIRRETLYSKLHLSKYQVYLSKECTAKTVCQSNEYLCGVFAQPGSLFRTRTFCFLPGGPGFKLRQQAGLWAERTARAFDRERPREPAGLLAIFVFILSPKYSIMFCDIINEFRKSTETGKQYGTF